jgi:hypothetical protein
MLEAFSAFGYHPQDAWLDALESTTLQQLQQTAAATPLDAATGDASTDLAEQGSGAGWKLQPRLSTEELVLLLEGLSSAAAAATASSSGANPNRASLSSPLAATAAAAASGRALQRPAGRWLSAWASQLGVDAVRSLPYGLAMRLITLLAQPHLQGFSPRGR